MVDLSLSESPIPPPRLGTSSPRKTTHRDWEELSNTLLEDGFILSALELYMELLESGKEVLTLRDYFSNPGNFENAIPQLPSSGTLQSMVRSTSHSTFDSMEFGRYSDDMDKENEDRVAVLEFELRKAFETIKSLRGSLTKATDIQLTKEGDSPPKIKTKSDEPIKPHEKRALNFLTHEYLMQQDNKLTAITFTEENGEQDFDDWDDVGLNIPKPPNLLNLFRNYSTCMLSDRDKLQHIQSLEDQLSIFTGQNLALKRENEALQLRQKKMNVNNELLKDQSHRRVSSLTNTQVAEALDTVTTRPLTRNSSSPDIANLSISEPANSKSVPSQLNKLSESKYEDTCERHDLKLNEAGKLVNKMRASASASEDGQGDEFSQSTNSAVSAKSDKTLEVNDSKEPRPFSTSRSLSIESGDHQSLGKEHSGSEATLINDKQDDERATPSRQKGESGHHMSIVFRQELLNMCQVKTDTRIGVEVSRLSDPDLDLVQLLGRCLPYIVPNVILAKREELIPVLLVALTRHPDSKLRDQLLHMMFNLIKRPDRSQRMVIMTGCVAVAKLTGPTRVECELLPQMWEQITHQYFERRLLVAETCGVLAPYIPAELRGSLVLSMLKQMLAEDKAESVRQAVARSLGVIVAFTDDESKFVSCWELLLKAITDPSQLVVSTTYSILLPALAAWAFELGTLEKDMLSYFLHQLLTCVKQVSRSDGESGAVEQSHHHVLTLTHLIPWHFATILLSGPYRDRESDQEQSAKEVFFPKPSSPLLDIEVIIGSSNRLFSLVAAFEKEIDTESVSAWTSLEWFQNEFLNKFVRILVALEFSQPELVHRLVILLSSYCIYLGHSYTHQVIKPFFEVCLKLPSSNAGSALAEGHTKVTTPVLVTYLAGVLAAFPKDEKLLISYLRTTIVDMALYFAPIDSLKASLLELRKDRKLHGLLLGVLQELSNHSSFQVRRYVAILLRVVSRGMDERLIMKSVVPQLSRLARDPEISVRVDTIASFGTIMETVTSKDILVRVHKQFESFFSGDQNRTDHQLLMGVLKTLAKIGPHADPVFRDEFIIPRLAHIAKANNTADNITKRQDVVGALLDAYTNISECFMSTELLTDYLLPGLECLKRDAEEIDRDKLRSVMRLVTVCTSKITDHQKFEQSTEQTAAADGKGMSFFSNFSKLRPTFDRSDLSISPSKLFKKKT